MTRKQYFDKIQCPVIKAMIMGNNPQGLNEWCGGIYSAFYAAFNWELTKEGREFWVEICNCHNPFTTTIDKFKHLLPKDYVLPTL